MPHLIALPSYKGQIAHVRHIPRKEARFDNLERPLPEGLERRLISRGFSGLYIHQAGAINAIRTGKNVMVATPSASGKTLCYNLPVLEELLERKSSRALYLFPTKALAQDQLKTLMELAYPDILSAGDCVTFDGDTPTEERTVIKRKARIVLSNPDMLHLGILPNHGTWSKFLRGLKYVVVDEAHIYKGVFGSHVSNVLRRLRRICRHYGSNPQFVCCSATISNPGEHAARLVGLPFEVVDLDGSARGEKTFIFWNPPLSNDEKPVRGSPNTEATLLLTELIRQSIRTLVFVRTRRLAELIYLYSRRELPPMLAGKIKPYRAGYLAGDRRQIERELFSGELLGVVSTTALELGIDIGDLEATVLTGYPGSVASTWQQAGRSGRRESTSLSFLIAQDNPLDQYFMHHPDYFFESKFENAIINPDNARILKSHLLCAAWEKPLLQSDALIFGAQFEATVTELVEEEKLIRRNELIHASPRLVYPAQGVNIRSASAYSFTLVDTSQGYQILETVEAATAFSQIHPGAIYLHQGESYLVTSLDLQDHTALAEPTDLPYYTQAKEITDVRVMNTEKTKEVAGVGVHFGEVDVTNEVVGFKKKAQLTEEVIGEEILDFPPQRFFTQALWFELPQKAIGQISGKGLDLAGGLHAVEHAAIGMLPLFALCDRNDIGGLSTAFHIDTGTPEIFIYDGYPGGVGIAEKGYDLIRELWAATLRAVEECPCSDGCPGCIQSPKCGNNNEPLDKKAAILLLKELTLSR